MYYLDASALVKLVATEPESAALFDFVTERREFVSSALAKTEVLRAVGRAGGTAALRRRALEVLAGVALVRIDDAILERAAALEPRELRTLDAIHLATALELGDELATFVAYDRQLSGAARQSGLEVHAPGA